MPRLVPCVPPEVMTARARAYLFTTAVYCFGIAAACLVWPERHSQASFTVVKALIPHYGLAGWGLIHLAVGLLAIAAAWRGRETYAIWTLVLAAACVGPWAFGFYWSFFTDPRASFTGPVAYAFITAIHIIQARQPLRSPFDPILRRIPTDND